MFPGFNPIMELKRHLKVILLLFTSILLADAKAADTLIKPGSPSNPANASKMFLQTADNKLVPATVVYTTDGNGNLVPINSTIQNINVGTVNQGASGNSSDGWYVRDTSSETSLAGILEKLDVNASTRASEATLASILGKVDVNLSTRATESTLSSLNSKVTACNTGSVTISSSVLPTGGSTSANQNTGNSSLASIDSKVPTQGQKTSTNSVPVVLASDQSTIPVSNTNIDVALSTRATEATVATLAKESGGNLATAVTKLTSIDNKTPVQGQTTMSASSPVVIASNQSTLPVDGTVELRNASSTDVNAQVVTSSGNSSSAAINQYLSAIFFLNVTAASGTTPKLDVFLQFSYDNVNFFDAYVFKRITAVDTYTTPVVRLTGNFYRFRYAVSGSSPSFTVTLQTKKLLSPGRIYRGTASQNLARNSTAAATPAMWAEGCDSLGFVVVQSGAGGNVDFSVEVSMDGTNFGNLNVTNTCGATTTPCVLTQNINFTHFLAYRYYRIRVTAAAASGTWDGFLSCNGG
jgi:hypothetical protein